MEPHEDPVDLMRSTLASLVTARNDGMVVVLLTRFCGLLQHCPPPRHLATTHRWLLARVEVLRDLVVVRPSPHLTRDVRALAADLLAGLDR